MTRLDFKPCLASPGVWMGPVIKSDDEHVLVYAEDPLVTSDNA